MEITVDTPIIQIRAKYPDMTKEKIEECKKKFKHYDLDGNGTLDFNEVKQMFEAIGEPKTHLECKDLIARIDTTGKGTLAFHDFMKVIAPPDGSEPLPLFGKIYSTPLGGKAKFFEEKMRENKGISQSEAEARVQREAALRKEAREDVKKAKEAADSKARFAERQNAFK